MSEKPDIVRIAGLDAAMACTDVHIIDANEITPVAWLELNHEAFRVRFPGGVVVLNNEAPDIYVEHGWRYIERCWLPPTVTVAEKVAEVNRLTRGSFAGGFFFRGMWFSLTIESQLSIQHAYAAREALPLPLSWANVDDTLVLELSSVEDVAEFHTTMARAVIQLRQEGLAAKVAIDRETA